MSLVSRKSLLGLVLVLLCASPMGLNAAGEGCYSNPLEYGSHHVCYQKPSNPEYCDEPCNAWCILSGTPDCRCSSGTFIPGKCDVATIAVLEYECSAGGVSCQPGHTCGWATPTTSLVFEVWPRCSGDICFFGVNCDELGYDLKSLAAPTCRCKQ